MESQESQSTVNVAQFVEKIILSKKINHLQYHQLSAAILADGEIDEEERYQINRLFDAIQLGQVKIVT
ncbi:MAG TPA: hypothetical protein V6C90_04785 [Coleofasciculaceae cyanobacterium]|jgi:uncharacterized membrane protein YebE (DUF533 family)